MENQDVNSTSNIPVFWDSTNGDAKDKFLQFASCLDKLSPDVAKKAIEQIPKFSITMLNIANGFHGTLCNLTKQNEESTNNVYDTYKGILDLLQKTQSSENLTFEQKKWVIDQMKEIAYKQHEKDSENKNFLLKLASIAGTVVLGVAGIVAKEKKPWWKSLFGK